jgi:dTDP-4-amino-4,6-dideoxygalactose transaminase
MLSLIPTEHWDYGPADMIRGLFAAIASSRPGDQSNIPIPGVGPSLPVRSARAGIVLGLKVLGLGPGATVAVPLYCCPVVFSAIQAAGCRARFIDIDPDTYCLSADDLAAKSSAVDAVIAVHMFGNICDVQALREVAPGKPVIEDCAQALGSRFGGRVAGSFGEIAAFSFRSGKYLSVGEGGAVQCGQKEVESQLSHLISDLPVPSRVEECVHVVKTCLRSLLRRKPLWGLMGSRLWSAYNERTSHSPQSSLVPGQVYETDRKLAVNRLSSLASAIERQRSIADYYSRTLTVDQDMLCRETPGAFFNRLQYPLLLSTPEQCGQMAARLLENEISTSRPYKDIAAIAATHYGYAGDCPQAERIAKTVLVIPCNHDINAAGIERIVTSVNRAWAEVGGRGRSLGVASVDGSATMHTQTGYGESVAEPQHHS